MHRAVELAQGSGKQPLRPPLADAKPTGNLIVAQTMAGAERKDFVLEPRQGGRGTLDALLLAERRQR